MAKRSVNFKGNPLTLLGNELKEGEKAPSFKAMSNGLAPVHLSDYAGKVVVLATVPSLDTPVCDLETRRFNSEAAQLGAGVQIVTASMDLPFAQGRWCGAAGVDRVQTLSDHKDADLGQKYGVLIEELRLLARAVFVIDKDGIVRHAQIVPDITEQPNYDTVLAAVKRLL
ncbi:MAG: thiol peroxidase [Myxococcota bacterium]|jgi:thiol peroxidase|nr:thiol peroxidase [Myxococcota bacterium]